MKRLSGPVIVMMCVLDSCGPAATFNKPQPEGETALTSFPQRLSGQYISADRASILTITDRMITRQVSGDVKTRKDSLGSSYRLSGDTLINLASNTKEQVRISGDTVIQHISWTDTLFRLPEKGILKKFNGYFFLNIRYDDTTWEVKKLSLENGLLLVGRISQEDGIRQLKAITETASDTVSRPFMLTPDQFRTFVQQDGFGERDTFIRIGGTRPE